jgi:histidyl-tRNA synthetase
MLERIEKEAIFQGHAGATKCLAQMKLLFTYIEAAGVIDYVTFDFSLARGLDYYTGLIYEAVLMQEGVGIGSISGGGRYDGLIGMFSNKEIPSVGGSIGIERIFELLEKKYLGSNTVRATETQVLVAQFGKKLVADRLKVCSELWAAGIKCETIYKENPSAQD